MDHIALSTAGTFIYLAIMGSISSLMLSLMIIPTKNPTIIIIIK
jgi:hypothetical protein